MTQQNRRKGERADPAATGGEGRIEATAQPAEVVEQPAVLPTPGEVDQPAEGQGQPADRVTAEQYFGSGSNPDEITVTPGSSVVVRADRLAGSEAAPQGEASQLATTDAPAFPAYLGTYRVRAYRVASAPSGGGYLVAEVSFRDPSLHQISERASDGERRVFEEAKRLVATGSGQEEDKVLGAVARGLLAEFGSVRIERFEQ